MQSFTDNVDRLHILVRYSRTGRKVAEIQSITPTRLSVHWSIVYFNVDFSYVKVLLFQLLWANGVHFHKTYVKVIPFEKKSMYLIQFVINQDPIVTSLLTDIQILYTTTNFVRIVHLIVVYFDVILLTVRFLWPCRKILSITFLGVLNMQQREIIYLTK